MDQAAGDTGYEELVGYLEVHDVINLFLARLEHDTQFLRLRDRSRKTIKDETGAVHGSVSKYTQQAEGKDRKWDLCASYSK